MSDAATPEELMEPKHDQILKCRDDKNPVVLKRLKLEPESEIAYKLADGSNCSWASGGEIIKPDKLRQRIEPWLTALFQSEHFGLLLGSGLTHAVHWMAANKSLPGSTPTLIASALRAAKIDTRKKDRGARAQGMNSPAKCADPPGRRSRPVERDRFSAAYLFS